MVDLPEPRTQNDTYETNGIARHTHYGWGITGFILLTLILGFVGGALAIRLYDSQLVQSETNEARQEIVLSESELIADIAKQIGPSVVSINIESESAGSSFFFDGPSIQSSAGTGIIVSEDGLVLTNKHVVPEGTVRLEIVLSDGTSYDDIDIVGRDPFNDIAFLKINGVKDLVPAELGDSDDIRVGDKVVAIGNALGQFDNTVTSGIISGTARPIVAGDSFNAENLQNLLQTDAAINPGNSGGPLVNIKGQVIGVNTAVAGGGAENIGFAIPINDVKSVLASVLERGEVIRAYLGVRYVMLTPSIAQELEVDENQGALITGGARQPAILPDSPAKLAGLEEGDVIVQINEHEVTNRQPLAALLNRYKVDDQIVITYIRDGQRTETEATLQPAPAQ